MGLMGPMGLMGLMGLMGVMGLLFLLYHYLLPSHHIDSTRQYCLEATVVGQHADQTALKIVDCDGLTELGISIHNQTRQTGGGLYIERVGNQRQAIALHGLNREGIVLLRVESADAIGAGCCSRTDSIEVLQRCVLVVR